jgi:HEAT repeat protein
MPLMRVREKHPPPEVARSRPSRDALLEALRSGETEAKRRQAALDLANEPDASDALGAALDSETGPAAREAIMTALVSIANQAAATKLAALLQSEDVCLRCGAAEALQQMGPAAEKVIGPLLQAANRDVRILAINVLETLCGPGARELLLGVLATDPEVNAGLAAVEALAGMWEPRDAAALRAFAARFPAEPFVSFAVAMACRRVTAGGAG